LGSDGILWTRKYVDMAAKGEDLNGVVNEVLARTDSVAICIGHNTVNKITHEFNGRLWFTDAMFSRAYSSETVQVLEIENSASCQVLNIHI
jgi:hypothetical protein